MPVARCQQPLLLEDRGASNGMPLLEDQGVSMKATRAQTQNAVLRMRECSLDGTLGVSEGSPQGETFIRASRASAHKVLSEDAAAKLRGDGHYRRAGREGELRRPAA
jgi:hypothetical protein